MGPVVNPIHREVSVTGVENESGIKDARDSRPSRPRLRQYFTEDRSADGTSIIDDVKISGPFALHAGTRNSSGKDCVTVKFSSG